MRQEAERYCSLIESAASLGREEFAAAVAASLVDLYAAALELQGGPARAEIPGSASIEEWHEHFEAVQKTLGDWDAFHTTLRPAFAQADIAVVLPVAGELVRVWSDLKPGLLALARGEDLGEVAWWWRFLFYAQWGGHAADALRALHPRLAAGAGFVSGYR